MIECCATEGIATNDDTNFRVILTGGFSNLYSVEVTVREAFGAPLCGKDARFDSGINRELRSTATAHGAAIIADGNMNVDELFQKNVGFSYFDVFDNNEHRVTLLKKRDLVRNVGFSYFDVFDNNEHRVTLLKKRDLVRNIRNPIYFNRVLPGKYLDENSIIKIFIEDRRDVLNVDINLDKLCPSQERLYTLGLSLGRRQTLFLHSLDDNGIHIQKPVVLA